MPEPSLKDDYRALTAVCYAMAAIALGMISVLAGLWLDVTPEGVCMPVGIAAAMGTLGAGTYAARKVGNRAETGPLAEWNRMIRTMGTIDMAVAVVLVAYPAIT